METILSGVAGVVVGAVVTAVTPSLVSATGTLLRGLAKEVIKGGLVVQEALSGMCGESGSYFNDLVKEARAELAATPSKETLPTQGRAGK